MTSSDHGVEWAPPSSAPDRAAVSASPPPPTRLDGPLSDRARTLSLSAAIFVFTFLVYYMSGGQATPYDFPLSQANNLLHGHLDMTAEYSRNLGILERALYDGEGFCLPVDDPRGPQSYALLPDARVTEGCKHYSVHGVGTALVLLPFVAVFGMSVNQALVACLFGAATAVLIFATTRRFSNDLLTQLALTVAGVFGTTLWYSAADGSVWNFALTTAAFFMFASVYATVAWRNPLLAGAFVGAAFLCRPTTILAGFFPLVAFSDQWLVARGGFLFDRINLRPLVKLALGAAPLVAVGWAFNYLRFGSPFEAGYAYIEEFFQAGIVKPFSPSYISEHVKVMFEQAPVFSTSPAFVMPSWTGLALWAISPALLMGLFVHLRHYRRPAMLAALAVLIAAIVIVLGAMARGFGWSTWSISQIPFGVHLLPFSLLVAAAISLAINHRDRLAIACWAAIIPIVLVNWMFVGNGATQLGYRRALDFLPFLFLLVVMAVPRVRRSHLVLVGATVLINLWGVLWVLKFSEMHLFGWTWVNW